MTDLQTVLNSLIEVARTITDLKRSILNAAEVDDTIGLADALAQLETLFCQWRQEVEKRA